MANSKKSQNKTQKAQEPQSAEETTSPVAEEPQVETLPNGREKVQKTLNGNTRVNN